MSERPPTADEARAADAALDTATGAASTLADGRAAVAAAPESGSVAVVTDPQSIEADEETGWHDAWEFLPSWLASTVLHLCLVLLLAVATTLSVVRDTAPPLQVLADTQHFDEGEPEELSADLLANSDPLDEAQAIEPEPLAELPALDATAPILPVLPTGDLERPASTAPANLAPAEAVSTLQSRLNTELRQQLLRSGGGTPESEAAVLAALVWLAEHQNYDGSWTFQHHEHAKCAGRCRHPGTTPGRIAATGLALLPFLGSGQTQYEGNHKRTIELGLKFLVRSIREQKKIGSLWDPHATMYGHGLASIALCEAYGMTHDPTLREPAQSVINYIVEAQDPFGGGWRYQPKTPGDTSVVGWQLMALKSGEMAYLRVPDVTFHKAGYFLDSVQGKEGAVYGYMERELRRPSTTAIGLLCRMYMGWPRDHEPLEQGVKVLATFGPSTNKTNIRNNMYYNYYATQVMHHYGGYPWERWNAVMRDYLVNTQAKKGHEYGSWFFDGADLGVGAGGRLYFTALATMTLEVYYRHMPLYRNQAATE